MKSVIKFSLNNKFALWIFTVAILCAGLYAGNNMKMESIPDISVPYVTVLTVYPGAAPEEVLASVSEPIEQRVRNLSGVKNVTSNSYENASSVIVEFDYGRDMAEEERNVDRALGELKLPKNVQSPTVSRLSFNMLPVIAFSVSHDSLDLAELTKLVESDLLLSLQGIEGVGNVQVSGQNIREGELHFNQEKLAQYGLTSEMVQGMIQASSLKVPLGIFEFGDTEKSVLVDGGITTEEELSNLEIPYNPMSLIPQGSASGAEGASGLDASGAGMSEQEMEALLLQQAASQGGNGQAAPQMPTGLPTVKLSELATLTIADKAESVSRTNGQDAIGVNIVKSSDANTVQVVNDVKAAIEEFTASHTGTTILTTLDQGKPIEESVSTMLSKALIGAIAAIVVIMLFLRNIRSTIIAVISIPVSLLIAVLLLRQMDITLNIMTLGAMTVAIGRVVDDSIVVIENIYRRMRLKGEQLRGKELVLQSTKEMFLPIMSSTLVTIAVFLPMGFVSGMVGELFMPFALTTVFALLASLLVAITIVPMMAHMLFRKTLEEGVGLATGKGADHEKPSKLAQWYKRTLNVLLDHKMVTSIVAILLLVGSSLLLPFIGFSFIGSQEEKILTVTYNPAPGETLEHVVDLALDVEKELLNRDGLRVMQYAVGSKNPMSMGSSKQMLFFLRYEENFSGFKKEKEDIIPLVTAVGGKGHWKLQDMTGASGVSSNSVSLVVYGPDMDSLRPIVNDLTSRLEKRDDLTKVESSLSEAYEQYRIVIDQAKLSAQGLTAGQVAMALSPVRERPELTTIEQDGKQLQIYMAIDEKKFESKEDLASFSLPSQLGTMVPLSEVATIEEAESPNTITKQNDRIYAEVTASITVSDVSSVSKAMNEVIADMDLPAGVTIKQGGVVEMMEEAFSQLGLAIGAAVVVVYLILVLTFGGAVTPFVILFSLPFSIIGALVGLFIAGETISVTAMIGALMLIGIVVTNAIVLIDRVIHKQREGLSVREALLEAAGTRLRPILMTAIATIAALLPMAVGFESGTLISKDMAITVIGGLASSTLLTLIIVPMMYELLKKDGNRKEKAARS